MIEKKAGAQSCRLRILSHSLAAHGGINAITATVESISRPRLPLMMRMMAMVVMMVRKPTFAMPRELKSMGVKSAQQRASFYINSTDRKRFPCKRLPQTARNADGKASKNNMLCRSQAPARRIKFLQLHRHIYVICTCVIVCI